MVFVKNSDSPKHNYSYNVTSTHLTVYIHYLLGCVSSEAICCFYESFSAIKCAFFTGYRKAKGKTSHAWKT